VSNPRPTRMSAVLDSTGLRVLCGSCRTELARVSEMSDRRLLTLGEEHRLYDDDVWRVTTRGKDRLRRGQEPTARKARRWAGNDEGIVRARPPREGESREHVGGAYIKNLPAIAECPHCGRRNVLESETLGIAP
jgi:hypothetical protein